MVINIFENEKKLIDLIKKSNRDLERGKFLDPFFQDQKTQIKLIKLFKEYQIEETKIIKIIKILWAEIKFNFKRGEKTISFSKKEEASMKKHLVALKKMLTQDQINKIDRGQYLQLFKPEKTLGKNNDKWLDTIDAMLEEIGSTYKNLDPKNKVAPIGYFVTSIGMKFEKLDPKFKPSTYFNEAKQKLSLGAEIIYIVANFYDKRITKRTIKSAFKNYKKNILLIRQLEGKK